MKAKYSYIKIKPLSLDEGGCHIMMHGLLNGKRLCFIVDTGSSRTVIDKETVEKYVVQPEGSDVEGKAVTLSEKAIDISTVQIERLSFGKTELSNYQAVVMDLSGVHNAYETLELPRIHGIIGGDILRQCNAVINYETCRIRLSR